MNSLYCPIFFNFIVCSNWRPSIRWPLSRSQYKLIIVCRECVPVRRHQKLKGLMGSGVCQELECLSPGCLLLLCSGVPDLWALGAPGSLHLFYQWLTQNLSRGMCAVSHGSLTWLPAATDHLCCDLGQGTSFSELPLKCILGHFALLDA